MVTKMTVPHSIQRALSYNEQKVASGAAECLYAHNFIGEAHELNFYQKLHLFQNLVGRNENATTNCLHISINFGNKDVLDRGKLIEIAQRFMEQIGFAGQPYLVYQHHDSGHPHVHIVTTNIQEDGRRISLHNLGRTKASEARKLLEEAFRLCRTGQEKRRVELRIQPASAQKALYGKMETKRSITEVLTEVLKNYKYTSLPELNAALKLYNVMADRGSEASKTYKMGGLTYRILDEDGKKIGVPVKASSIYFKPTLPYLERRFSENHVYRTGHEKRLKSAIDWALRKQPGSISNLVKALAQEKVSLVIRAGEKGNIYGLTYIDHQTKCVFNGSDLGKAYAAKGILERCNISLAPAPSTPEKSLGQAWTIGQAPPAPATSRDPHNLKETLIDILLRPEKDFAFVPKELKRSKKRKKVSQH